jgi:putative MATE family efflux protein
MQVSQLSPAESRDRLSAATEALLSKPVLPLLLRFALPNTIALLAASLASISETAFAGRFGTEALAGLALVFPFVMLQTMMSAGAMGGGVSSAISRALGAGQPERAQALAAHALLIAVTAGTVYMVLLLAGGSTFFSWLGGKGETLRQAVSYSQIAFLGSIFMWVVNTLSSVLRGGGNMLVPSAVLLAVSITQVALSGLLGLGFGPVPSYGMSGVAAGQVIAYAGGTLFLVLWLRSSRSRIRLTWPGGPVRADMLADILKVGAFACISPLQTVLTILILTRLVAQFGTEALAGYGIGARLEFLLIPVAFAIGVASVPLVGLAIGAGKTERARRAAWSAAALAMVILTVIGIVVTADPDLWTTLFTLEPAIRASAASYFHWAGPFYGLFGLGLSLYFSSLGAGRVAGPVLAGTVRLVIVAAGGLALALVAAPTWSIFALIGLGMAIYGLSTAGIVWKTSWVGPPR